MKFKSDFIFHLAGVNRANTEIEVYDENKEINLTLLNYLIKIKFNGKLFFPPHNKKIPRYMVKQKRR